MPQENSTPSTESKSTDVPHNSLSANTSSQKKGAQVRSFSIYQQDLQRLKFLQEAMAARCSRPVSNSMVMRVALKVAEREWYRHNPKDAVEFSE